MANHTTTEFQSLRRRSRITTCRTPKLSPRLMSSAAPGADLSIVFHTGLLKVFLAHMIRRLTSLRQAPARQLSVQIQRSPEEGYLFRAVVRALIVSGVGYRRRIAPNRTEPLPLYTMPLYIIISCLPSCRCRDLEDLPLGTLREFSPS
jgi:hypothetical protein